MKSAESLITWEEIEETGIFGFILKGTKLLTAAFPYCDFSIGCQHIIGNESYLISVQNARWKLNISPFFFMASQALQYIEVYSESLRKKDAWLVYTGLRNLTWPQNPFYGIFILLVFHRTYFGLFWSQAFMQVQAIGQIVQHLPNKWSGNHSSRVIES